jgi:hypothetical protein
MRDYNGPSYQVGNGKHFKDLLGSNAQFVTLAQVILYTIVAPQNHGTRQTNHLFGNHIYAAAGVAISIKIKKSFQYDIICPHDFIIHAAAVLIEVVY